MRAPLSWLRDYAPLDAGPAELADAPVQPRPGGRGRRARSAAAWTTSWWPGSLDIRAHPDADRIRLVDVDAGDGDARRSCAAPGTSQVGDLVPLAAGGRGPARRASRSPDARCGASGPTACCAAPDELELPAPKAATTGS